VKWHPPTKAQEACKTRRQRNLGAFLQRGLEQDIEHRILYGDRKNVLLEEWERDYLKALIEDNAAWQGTRQLLTTRLNKSLAR
jgi:hypothetical protein